VISAKADIARPLEISQSGVQSYDWSISSQPPRLSGCSIRAGVWKGWT